MTTQQESRLRDIKKDLAFLMDKGKIKQDTNALDHIQSVIEDDDGFLAFKIIKAFYQLKMTELAEILGDMEWDKLITFDERFV